MLYSHGWICGTLELQGWVWSDVLFLRRYLRPRITISFPLSYQTLPPTLLQILQQIQAACAEPCFIYYQPSLPGTEKHLPCLHSNPSYRKYTDKSYRRGKENRPSYRYKTLLVYVEDKGKVGKQTRSEGELPSANRPRFGARHLPFPTPALLLVTFEAFGIAAKIIA